MNHPTFMVSCDHLEDITLNLEFKYQVGQRSSSLPNFVVKKRCILIMLQIVDMHLKFWFLAKGKRNPCYIAIVMAWVQYVCLCDRLSYKQDNSTRIACMNFVCIWTLNMSTLVLYKLHSPTTYTVETLPRSSHKSNMNFTSWLLFLYGWIFHRLGVVAKWLSEIDTKPLLPVAK